MVRRIGSQFRETLKESGYTLTSRSKHIVIIENSQGRKELWHANDDYAGYVVQIGNHAYEFVTSIPYSTN